MRTHEQYEELCGQVAVGRLSEAEWADLEEHLQTCAECRQAAGKFFRLGIDILPRLSHLYGAGRVPSGMKERFLARAQAEGLPLGPEAPEHVAACRPAALKRPAILWAAWVASIVLAVLATAVVLEQFRKHHEQANQARTTPQVTPAASPVPDVAPDTFARLTSELSQARDEAKNAIKQLNIQREELESGKRKQAELESRIAALAQTDNDLSQRNAQLAQLQQELSRTRADNEALRSASTAKDSQVNVLQSKVSTLTTDLEEERRLSTASNQARDLIVARNLHIVDIHDDDEEGKRQRPFGRIFYIEGKELIFYAYDLTDSKTINAKITFYVWGERKGSERSVTKLGIIRSDDARAGRWKLTFDDPQTLARIDSVFVTGESGTNTPNRPRGDRILSAYLGNKANHP